MGNYSRDSFMATGNAFGELLGLLPTTPTSVRNYVSVRMQQAVPVLDADWNEEGDIRRRELELLLWLAIGDGVPAGNNGFCILPNGAANSFSIQAGLIFSKGWVVYNRSSVAYGSQPYGNAPGAPGPLQTPTQVTTFLVYLDTWEFEVNSQTDVNLVDARIGVETCVRLERAWVARVAPLAANANPRDPANIPTQQAGHRYCALATISRPSNNPMITADQITDLRRTHLSLAALTHAPLQLYDAARDQNLDATRLTLMFQSNLGALTGFFKVHPDAFVYSNNAVASAQVMTALNDTRASATSFQQQSQAGVLHREAAVVAMQTFLATQTALSAVINQFVISAIAGANASAFVQILNSNLNGSSATDPTSLIFALNAGDLLGAVMAQERLNQALGQNSNTLPEGTLAANLTSVTPQSAVAPNASYQLTFHVQSFLTSAAQSEAILVTASAGPGWSINFQGTTQPTLLVPIASGQAADVVLIVQAATGALPATLNLSVRPQRAQQIVYRLPPIPLALGQTIITGAAPKATLTYQGPQLQFGNVANIPRTAMGSGINIPFLIVNLSGTETYQITAKPQGAGTGWVTPIQSTPPQFAPNQSRIVSLNFKTTDPANAETPETFVVQVVRITNGANEPQTNTNFSITFQLT
jgi:hypothetical protein